MKHPKPSTASKRFRPRHAALLVAVMAALVAGCASRGVDLVATDAVALAVEDSRFVSVHDVRVRQSGGELTVRGGVQRKPGARGPVLGGHVDLEIEDPSGRVLRRERVEYGSLPLKGSRHANFSWSANMTLAPGSTIRIRCHEGTHP